MYNIVDLKTTALDHSAICAWQISFYRSIKNNKVWWMVKQLLVKRKMQFNKRTRAGRMWRIYLVLVQGRSWWFRLFTICEFDYSMIILPTQPKIKRMLFWMPCLQLSVPCHCLIGRIRESWDRGLWRPDYFKLFNRELSEGCCPLPIDFVRSQQKWILRSWNHWKKRSLIEQINRIVDSTLTLDSKSNHAFNNGQS